MHREAGRIDEAILSLREVVALTPDDSRAWLELGQLYYQKENDVTANACLDAALQLDPHLITALMIRGEIEETSPQQETRALEFYHRVLSLEENYPPALLKIARIQMRHNESVRASVLLRSVCYCRGATPGQIAEARWLLGLSYGQQLRWDDAIESMSIAIEIMEQPGADDLYYLAYAQYQSEQHLEVEQTLDRLLALQPNHGPARSLKQAAVREEKRLLGEIQQASGIEPIPPPPPLGLDTNSRQSPRCGSLSGLRLNERWERSSTFLSFVVGIDGHKKHKKSQRVSFRDFLCFLWPNPQHEFVGIQFPSLRRCVSSFSTLTKPVAHNVVQSIGRSSTRMTRIKTDFHGWKK